MHECMLSVLLRCLLSYNRGEQFVELVGETDRGSGAQLNGVSFGMYIEDEFCAVRSGPDETPVNIGGECPAVRYEGVMEARSGPYKFLDSPGSGVKRCCRADDGPDKFDDVDTAATYIRSTVPTELGEECLGGCVGFRLVNDGWSAQEVSLALCPFFVLSADPFDGCLALCELVQAPQHPGEMCERVADVVVAGGAELPVLDQALQRVSKALGRVAVWCDSVLLEDPGEVSDVAPSSKRSGAQRGAWAG